ncbi:unnamed protein product [Larinioides sclopetarius]|uniref:Uncharacterized protein n=1 Tax=Larinioides sclopetarius TaxID=280406 RepID=A0AAV1YSS0_9ARAC
MKNHFLVIHVARSFLIKIVLMYIFVHIQMKNHFLI